MAQFTVNPRRFDPYKNFRFRVKWDGRYVAGISKVGALKRTTEVVEHREGGDPCDQPQIAGPDQVRGDHARARRDPRPRVRAMGQQGVELRRRAGSEVSLADFRKDVILDLFNEAGQKVLSYQIFRCWVSEYQALPDLDANANAVAIQTLKLENEGWLRDVAVVEPVEQGFTFPARLTRPARAGTRGP